MMQTELLLGRKSCDHTWLACALIAAAFIAAAMIAFPYDRLVIDTGVMRGFPLYHTFIGRVLRLTGKFDVVVVFGLLICWATDDRRTLWRLILAAALMGLVVTLTKQYVGRIRPDGHARSFPSGDTAAAFMWATLLAFRSRKLAPVGFLAAAAVGALRVAADRHFPSDVFVGAGVGLACGSLAVRAVRQFVPRWISAVMTVRWSGWVVAGIFALYVGLKAFSDAYILALAASILPAVAPALIRGRLSGRRRGLPANGDEYAEDPGDGGCGS